jgi:D-amino-acid dehydrogenase
MKVLVLGGGVIGVTTAYFLSEAGHEVTVLDRQQGPALETSFANAGEVSPGYASPWAGPGIPTKAVKWLLMKYGPLVVRPAFDPHMWTWLLKMLRNCTAERYALNKSRMVPLAEYSRDTLKALRAATGIAYDERTQGTLQLFRKQKQLDGTGGDVEVLKKYGVPYELLDRDGCIGAEPALAAVREKFVGGLRLPGDETGDCKMFTDRLAELCVARGVTFDYSRTIRRVVRDRNRVSHVLTDQGARTSDAYVMALGSYSPQFMRKMKRPVPVYPVKGYSITVQLDDAACRAAAPQISVVDDAVKLVSSRLGEQRLRVAGTAEFHGFNRDIRADRIAPLIGWVQHNFPEVSTRHVTPWAGLRPMMPDLMPRVGPGKAPGVFYNTGHGHLGWTLAAATADMVATNIASSFGSVLQRTTTPLKMA